MYPDKNPQEAQLDFRLDENRGHSKRHYLLRLTHLRPPIGHEANRSHAEQYPSERSGHHIVAKHSHVYDANDNGYTSDERCDNRWD